MTTLKLFNFTGIMHIAESQIIECPNEMVSRNLQVKVKDGSNPGGQRIK